MRPQLQMTSSEHVLDFKPRETGIKEPPAGTQASLISLSRPFVKHGARAWNALDAVLESHAHLSCKRRENF